MKILSLHTITNLCIGVFFNSTNISSYTMDWIKNFWSKGHQKVVDIMNWFLVKSLLILGIPVTVKNKQDLPENATLIFVSNHQGMFDIPPIIWHFRKYKPKFVSKIELAKGIPSISFNLRHGGAALIDRKDPKQAISALVNFAKRIKEKNGLQLFFQKEQEVETESLKILQ